MGWMWEWAYRWVFAPGKFCERNGHAFEMLDGLNGTTMRCQTCGLVKRVDGQQAGE